MTKRVPLYRDSNSTRTMSWTVILSETQLVDLHTKALPPTLFHSLKSKLKHD
jgi:hypothetical protein